MRDDDWLADQFEQNRGHLRAVAYRLLGSGAEEDGEITEMALIADTDEIARREWKMDDA